MLGDVISNASNITAKGRLAPGQMVLADLQTGTFMENDAISRQAAARQPYKEWVAKSIRRLTDIAPGTFIQASGALRDMHWDCSTVMPDCCGCVHLDAGRCSLRSDLSNSRPGPRYLPYSIQHTAAP